MKIHRIVEGHMVTFDKPETRGLFWLLVELALDEGEVVAVEGHYWTREGDDFVHLSPDDPQAQAFAKNALA